MAHSRGLQFRGTRSPRRKTGWSGGPEGQTATLTASGQALVPTSQLALEDGLTIVRVRGNWTVQTSILPDLLTGPNLFTFGLGLCLVTQQAFVIGATAVPGPLSEDDWDGWMWHHHGVASAGFKNSAVANVPISYEVDTKAMRKISENMVLCGVMEVIEDGVAGSIATLLRSRMLFKIP